eukprot:1534546-Pyramimonas_sp.AAC.1
MMHHLAVPRSPQVRPQVARGGVARQAAPSRNPGPGARSRTQAAWANHARARGGSRTVGGGLPKARVVRNNTR